MRIADAVKVPYLCAFNMQILKDDTRRRILTQSRKLFLEKGFRDTTTRDIAQASGVVLTNEFKAQFGNDYFVGILTTCDNHFTHDNLSLLRELGSELMDSLSYADLRDLGVFNRLSADWAVCDEVHALLGYDLFAARGGMFERYKNNSEVWVKVKYSF